ncbi:hypothetical protein CTAYLR_005428 [Chrysophaeum taylorii]|uniref:Ribosomal protein S6 n=1 Tax=Chrysophaeum taylorii TaxID=2483200 RepID=A0AAD7XSE5_9STRA|nr:hypothetical protein CTAYLR_005428 [Chrysophaeum taylorii]
MPLYHSIVTTTALMQPRDLTNLFRRCAKQINAQGGVFRSCENYGLKAFPHRVRSRHASAGSENRYHYFGRKVAMYYDCSATTLTLVEHSLKMNEGVLRVHTLRPKTKMDKVNSLRKDNPWRAPSDSENAAAAAAEEGI